MPADQSEDPDAEQSAQQQTAASSQPPGYVQPGTPGGNRWSMRGERFEVDTATGAATASVPIALPPARAGFTPSLSLSYSSLNTNESSVFGYGWAMPVASVTRSDRYGSDQLYSISVFDLDLFGQRVELVPLNVPVGTEYGTYAAKREADFPLVQLNADSSWTVKTKQGIAFTFGTTAAERQDDPANAAVVYRWMLTRAEDASGNSWAASYYKDSGQIYLREIVYNGYQTTAGNVSVRVQPFATGTPAVRADQTQTMRPRFLVTTRHRASSIEVLHDGRLVRRYDLAFTPGQNGVRSLLTSVTQTAWDQQGNASVWPATTFSYGQRQPTWTEDNTWLLPQTLNYGITDNGIAIMDVNGDALNDAVRSMMVNGGYTERTVWPNTGNGWGAGGQWNPPAEIPPLARVDGLDNWVRVSDVNGDSRLDFIYSDYWGGSNPANHRTFLNTGSGWAMAADSYYLTPTFNTDESQSRDSQLRLVDVNGDGLPDLLQCQYRRMDRVHCGATLNTGRGWDSEGRSFDATPLEALNLEFKDASTFADVNHDGLLDVIWALDGTRRKVYLNTGTSFQESATWQFPTLLMTSGQTDAGVRLFDINGDNLLDVVQSLTNGDWTVGRSVWLNTGSGWTSSAVWANALPVVGFAWDRSTTPAGVRIEDVNGDGAADIISEPDGRVQLFHAYLADNGQADLLVSMASGEGLRTDVQWKPSSQYRDASGNLLNQGMTFILPTVSQVGQTDGTGEPAVITTYRYAGGQYLYLGALNREFTGFAWVEATDAAGTSARTYFHQGGGFDGASIGEHQDTWAKRGRPYRTEVRDASGTLLKTTIQRYQQQILPAQSTFGEYELEQYQVLNNINYLEAGGLAQTFTVGATDRYADRVKLYGYDRGMGTVDVAVHLYNVDAQGRPAGTSLVDGRLTVPSSGQSFRTITVQWDRPVRLLANTGYAIEVYPINGWYHSYSGTDVYPGGRIFRYSGGWQPSAGEDIAFALPYANRDSVFISREVEISSESIGPPRSTAAEYQYDQYGNVTQQVNYGEVSANQDGTFTDIGDDAVTVSSSYAQPVDPSSNRYGFPSGQALHSGVGAGGALIRQQAITYDGLPDGQVDQGLPTEQRDLLLPESQWVSARFTYDQYGNKLTETDAAGAVTALTYDEAYHMFPVRQVNALGHAQTATFDPVIGQARVVTDPNGAVVDVRYDAWGRPLEKWATDPTGQTVDLVRLEQVVYQDTPVNGIRSVTLRQWSDAVTFSEQTDYLDGFNRRRQQKAVDVYPGYAIASDISYDALGRPTRVSLPYRTSQIGYAQPDLTQVATEFSYDGIGRLTERRTPLGTARSAYAPWSITMTDELTRQRRESYDAFGQMVMLEEPNPASGQLDGGRLITQYRYGPQGELLGLTDPVGNVREFSYDSFGRQRDASDLHPTNRGDYHSYRYTYDAVGNLTRVVDLAGITTYLYYDLLRRPVREVSGGKIQLDYWYDLPLNYGVGRLNQVRRTSTVPNEWVLIDTYHYTPAGQLASQYRLITAIRSTAWITRWGYDYQGRPTAVVQPDSSRTDYSYDRLGQLAEVRWSGTTSGSIWRAVDTGSPADQTATAYAANGSLQHAQFGLSAGGQPEAGALTLTYDPLQLYRLTRRQVASSAAGTLVDYQYAYDAVGNILEIVDQGLPEQSSTRRYRYDALDRLLGEDSYGSSGQLRRQRGFSYDLIGNLTVINDVLNPGSGEIAITASYAYDGRSAPGLRGASFANPAQVTRIDQERRESGVVVERLSHRFAYSWGGRRITRAQYRDGNAQAELVDYYSWNARGELLQVKRQLPDRSTPLKADYKYGTDGFRLSSRLARGAQADMEVRLSDRFEISYGSSGGTRGNPLRRRLALDSGGAIIAADEPGRTDGYPTVLYHYSDHLGSLAAVAPASGAPVLRQRYTPYGAIEAEAAPVSAAATSAPATAAVAEGESEELLRALAVEAGEEIELAWPSAAPAASGGAAAPGSTGSGQSSGGGQAGSGGTAGHGAPSSGSGSAAMMAITVPNSGISRPSDSFTTPPVQSSALPAAEPKVSANPAPPQNRVVRPATKAPAAKASLRSAAKPVPVAKEFRSAKSIPAKAKSKPKPKPKAAAAPVKSAQPAVAQSKPVSPAAAKTGLAPAKPSAALAKPLPVKGSPSAPTKAPPGSQKPTVSAQSPGPAAAPAVTPLNAIQPAVSAAALHRPDASELGVAPPGKAPPSARWKRR